MTSFTRLPPRSTVICRLPSMRMACRISSSVNSLAGRPSSSMITSPRERPASAPGEDGATGHDAERLVGQRVLGQGDAGAEAAREVVLVGGRGQRLVHLDLVRVDHARQLVVEQAHAQRLARLHDPGKLDGLRLADEVGDGDRHHQHLERGHAPAALLLDQRLGHHALEHVATGRCAPGTAGRPGSCR